MGKSVMRRTAIVTLATVAGAVILTGCGDKYQEPFKDAPRGTTNNERADLITMPDGFSNASTKCDHGNRVYTLYHGDEKYGSIAVVPQDPTCR
ncbi:hypothetical protein [Streptomyces sp. NPDC059743]|uniref:hypothetical protein n=1 Tax=Streptomyces sp. NPDC059743 TaxID=3346928 RepID=UPI003659A57F